MSQNDDLKIDDDDIHEVVARQHQYEEQLRASSPSTISTASSGSPLVRANSGHSAAANQKRPPPTSIAAAQLLCQQQRLEFYNQQQASGKISHGKAAKQQSNERQRVMTPNWLLPGSKPADLANETANKKCKVANNDEQTAKIKAKKSFIANENGKSAGYNMAKSIAFRAYRFNEFWSVNKLRYMNFACLALTLICLVTILLFSNSNGSPNQKAGLMSDQERIQRWRESQTIWAKTAKEFKNRDSSSSPTISGNNSNEDLFVESIDALDSQPLTAATSVDPIEEPKIRRKSENSVAVGDEQKQGPINHDREVEETTSTTELPFNGLRPHGNSFIEPLLSQIFQDLEISQLLKSVNGSGTTISKPMIRRGKNGITGTIIIKSSGLFNESALNGTNDSAVGKLVPTLLEKLLPPSLLLDSRLNDSNSKNGILSGTITFGGSAMEPLFGAGSSSPQMIFSRADGGDPFDSLFRDHHHHRRHHHHHMRPLESEAGRPALSLFAGGPSPFGPPPPFGLLSMMMRQAAADLPGESSSSDDFPRFFGPFGSIVSRDEPSETRPNETLAVAASTNVTTGNDATSKVANESLVELAPAPGEFARGANKFHSIYPSFKSSSRAALPKRGGSMVIISSGSLDPMRSSLDGPFPFPFGSSSLSPFVALPPPDMLMVGSSSNPSDSSPFSQPHHHQQQQSHQLDLLMRGLLGNIMTSDPIEVSLNDKFGDKSKTWAGKSMRRVDLDRRRSPHHPQQASSLMPTYSDDGNEDENEQPSSIDKWDSEQNNGLAKSAGRYGGAGEFMEEENDMDSDVIKGIQFSDQPLIGGEPVVEENSVSGTIRQSIRGPGVTVERIIEVPSGIRREMVAPGLRSQSLSLDSDNESKASSKKSRFFRDNKSSIDRSSDDSSPPHMSFISRIMSDLTRNTSGARFNILSSPGTAQPSKSRHFTDDDLVGSDADEIPTLPMVNSNGFWGPKIKVASARLRLREPVMESRSSKDPFLFIQPTHTTPVAGDDFMEPIMADLPSRKFFEPSDSTQEFSENNKQTKMISADSTNDRQMEVNKNGDKSSPSLTPRALGAIMPQKIAISLSSNQETKHQVNNNPFTSPSSPLFGFPASSLMNHEEQSTEQVKSKAPPVQSQRQQRSFTYHSNNEIASPFVGAEKKPTMNEPLVQESTSHQARFMQQPSQAFLGPPAGIIMGRRLDDHPSAMMINEQSSEALAEDGGKSPAALWQQQQQSASSDQGNYKTIVV